jgi:hypothetical protein
MAAIPEHPPVVVYQFHVLLLDISPAIWRRVLIRNDSTVADLHATLQIVMGWEDDHLHRFVLHGKEYGRATYGGIGFGNDPRRVRLCDWHLRPKERLRYEYDFHAHWHHQLRLEQIRPLSATDWYPRCVGGARQAPPEGCGGAEEFLTQRHHYNPWFIESRLVEIVEMLLDNPGEDYADYLPELRELHYWWTWEQVDRRAINRRLHQYATGTALAQCLSEEGTDAPDSTSDH